MEKTSVGAALIPAGDVRKMLTADLSRAGYVVVEVGVFPGSGDEVDLSAGDFTLLAGANSVSERPADAEAIAAVVTKTNRPLPLDDGIRGTAGSAVGIGSSNDPMTGRRTGTSTVDNGAGIGNGPPGPVCRRVDCEGPLGMPNPPAAEPVPESTRQHIEQDLWEKSLPDGKTGKPVAGYLYFPKPSGKPKNAAWVLRWEGPSGRVDLEVRPAGH